MSRRYAPLLAAAAVLALSGCISVLPKEKPVQMYRFGAELPAAPASAGPKVGLVLARTDLPRAAAGDRILAITGDQAAYVAGARWVSPAAVLFEDAISRAFDARARAVRLLSRGETGAAQGGLRVDVTDFETRYAAAGATPTVRVRLQAMLLRRNGGFVADQAFAAEVAAADNSVHAIVVAYGQATDQAEMALVAWTDANAALVLTPDPAPPRPVSATTTTSTTTTVRER